MPIFGARLNRCSCDVLISMLFGPPLRDLDNIEAEAALQAAIVDAATGVTRIADLYLAAQLARLVAHDGATFRTRLSYHVDL